MELETRNTAKLIKERASSSPVFKAMCEVFADRERTRQQVSVHSLTVRMQKKGYKFTRAEYARELEFLAHLGIGTLIKSRTGIPRILHKIGVTLQSIGLVGLNKKSVLEKTSIQSRDRRAVPRVATPHKSTKATLILNIENRRMALDLTPNISNNELLSLIFKIAAVPQGVVNER